MVFELITDTKSAVVVTVYGIRANAGVFDVFTAIDFVFRLFDEFEGDAKAFLAFSAYLVILAVESETMPETGVR